jgi:hypothetical protein
MTENGSDETVDIVGDWTPTHWLGPLPVPDPPQ